MLPPIGAEPGVFGKPVVVLVTPHAAARNCCSPEQPVLCAAADATPSCVVVGGSVDPSLDQVLVKAGSVWGCEEGAHRSAACEHPEDPGPALGSVTALGFTNDPSDR